MKYSILLLLLISGIYANSQSLTLDEAINIALQNSYGIKMARNRVEIANINNNYANAGGMPVVNATVGDNQQITHTEQKYSDASRNTNTNNNANSLSASMSGSMLLYNGERVVNAKKRLELEAETSEQQLTSKQLNVVANVMLKYFDIVRQQNYVSALKKNIEVSQQKLDIIKTQQSVGLANNADLFQSQVDLNTQQQTLQTQELVVQQAKTDLLTILSLNPDSTIAITDTIIVDRNIVLDSILNNINVNPDIVMASQQIAINEYLQKEVAAQRYPSVSLNGGVNYNRNQNSAGFSLLNQNYGPYLGINLTVPIFNGGLFKKQQTIAGINTRNAELLKDTLVLGFTSSVTKSWQAYQNNLRQLKTAKETYDLSGELLNLILQKFQLRQATIVEVKQAQQSFEAASFLLVNLSYAAKAAEIQLKWLGSKL